MRKHILYIFLIICTSCLSGNLYGQKTNYQQFENIIPGPEAPVISCFLQDSQGLIWIGSNKGLFSYDGYSTQTHFKFGERSNTRIYCGIIADSTRLYLGADNGILIYNYKTDQYEKAEVTFPTDVRTMVLQGKTLWIGTLNGLYTYQLQTKKLATFKKENSGLPHSTIYSIICTQDRKIYVGTYDGLCYYQPQTHTFERITLPTNQSKNNQFVNSLLEDTTRHCIWIGTEGSLFKYTPKDKRVEQIEVFHDNSIKSLALDGNGYLLAGTDNGLYVYRESEEQPQHIVHDSRNIQSLSNNIIWNIFTDKEQNIWLGTDYGISLSRYNNAFQYIPIAQITGTGDGNQFYSMFRDSRGNFWFGGTNGLIRFSDPTGSEHNANWYKMGDKTHPLPHSRIRHIYEDKEHQLWIATDGSINRYDYNSRQFQHYNIIDSTGTYNTNWAYHLFEDNSGHLWIATCLGGIFVVDKHKLMQSAPDSYVAEYNYSTRNGLSGMFINQIIPDHEGNVWVLLYNNGIDKINIRTRTVTKIPTGNLTGDRNPNFILCDHNGFIWTGFPGGVMCINPKDNSSRQINFDTYTNNEVLSMMEADGHIWISTTNGFWVVNQQTWNARRLSLTDKRFTSLFFDSQDKRIYLGSADGFAISHPKILTVRQTDRPVILTALYVNNQLMNLLPGQEERSIRYAGHIELNYKQNNLSFELSDLPYSLEEKNKFVYRLEGMDKDWNFLKNNTNRITYSNLDYGDYHLVISKLDSNGTPSKESYTLQVHILPPWYYTPWAKGIYIILCLSLIAWIINFFRVKNRLKIERIEKEKILEQSQLKIDFFTNLSHDLKTPLSMIIAPISKLLPEVKDDQEKRLLEGVQRNAMKLNSLIHQVLDFNRVDSNSSSLLILSRIELVSFTRNLFSIYEEESGKEKHLTFHFQTNQEKIYTEMDAIKLESVVSNLLSNAIKYTPENGTIHLMLYYRKETEQLDISVSDSGVGIPKQDIPYIFQRFFQSSRTAGKKEGTGIGLYLVKTYTELHGGTISIASEEGTGTAITLTLPITTTDDDFQPIMTKEQITVQEPEATTGKEEQITEIPDDKRPLVLIVDDNLEITGFIYQILCSKYRCQIAGNGKEGLELCKKTQPDLIISDIMMPLMNGLEMCKLIKKHTPTSTIPIILLTAKSDKETELESIQLHIDAFIPKPFEPDILLSRVEQLLSNKQTWEAKTRIEVIAAPKAIEAVSQDEKFLSGITQLIEDHVSDADLNVNALCDLSGISNKQIYRKMTQLTGMTPVEYIKSIRMKKAAMLLQQKKFTVAEVMYMVGYSNHSYFSKCFQAEFGKTPKQYLMDN